MRTHAALLSLKDWCHERALSLCGVIALASMLTPLLALYGLRTGVIERMRAQLLQDPTVLVIMPAGGGGAGFSATFLASVASHPECSFCIGRIRDVASELQVAAANEATLVLSLEASAPGDPLLARHGVPAPEASAQAFHIVLTASAAKRLGVEPGGELTAPLGRRRANGKFERKEIRLKVSAVLPAQALGTDTGFVPMDLLLAIQDFRDGFASALLEAEGNAPQQGERYFESFRAYVRSIDDVATLERWFTDQHIIVKTKSRDIANIKNMDEKFFYVIAIIAAVSVLGFLAFMGSSIQASVRRKWKMLGMLRLVGYSRWSMLVYPVTQALATGVLGVLASLCAYFVVSSTIDIFFSSQTGGQTICFIHLTDILYIVAGVVLIVVIAACMVSRKALYIEPSAVIREN